MQTLFSKRVRPFSEKMPTFSKISLTPSFQWDRPAGEKTQIPPSGMKMLNGGFLGFKK